MSKIAIFTVFRGLYNYGQILQAYALTEYLNKNGHDAFLVEYKHDVDATRVRYEHHKNLQNYLKCAIKELTLFDNIAQKLSDKKKFLPFKKKHLKIYKDKYNNIYQLKNNPPQAEVYLTGSDQIWGIHMARIEAFFLNFGSNKIKRIAYAPSFGRPSLAQSEIKKLTPLINAYQAIGVRESSAIELCNLLNYKNAEWVPDPTILLTQQEWKKVMDPQSPFKTHKKKIFIYIIGEDNDQRIIQLAERFSNKEMIICSDNLNNKYQNSNLPIQSWISAINNCDLMITNSFHGTMFSLIFQKNFYTFERIGDERRMNVRINSLLDLLNLKKHIIPENANINLIPNLNISNWDEINEKFSNWKEKGISFLTKNI